MHITIQGSASDIRAKVEQHSKAIDDVADAMSSGGIGLHATQGHVGHLRRMAGAMRADGAVGKTPYEYHGVGLYASADAAPALPRPVLRALHAAGVEVVGEGKVSLAELDRALAAAGVSERVLIKTELARLGRLTA